MACTSYYCLKVKVVEGFSPWHSLTGWCLTQWRARFKPVAQPGLSTILFLPVWQGYWTESLVPRVRTESLPDLFASGHACKRSQGSWKLKQSRGSLTACRSKLIQIPHCITTGKHTIITYTGGTG